MERVDAVAPRWMPSKSAVELAGDSRLADSGSAGLQNGREATEDQTVGLATDSELEVFKPWSLVDGIGLGLSSEALIARMRCAKSPNDLKLSDRGARRGTCMAGGKAAVEAGAVTCGAVRCSAWLGVPSDLRQRWRVAAKRRVKVTAALRAAASGRLCRWADGNAAKRGWGAGRKPPAKRTDDRAGDVERSCAADSESEAQTGETQLTAARVATWPKPGNVKLSQLVRDAARVNALASPADGRATSDC